VRVMLVNSRLFFEKILPSFGDHKEKIKSNPKDWFYGVHLFVHPSSESNK
jgi:hypothetical protein